MSYVFPSVDITDELTGAGTTNRKTIRAATTAALTIATALNAGDTIDGVVLAAGDRVLVKDQAAPLENGVYEAGPSPARSDDYAAGTAVGGTTLTVSEGAANADSLWICTANGPADIVGADPITFIRMSVPAGGAGDVFGPATAALNALPRFADTTGKLLAATGVTVDGANNMVGLATLSVNTDITVGGTVDGVNVSALKVDFDGVTAAKGDLLVYDGTTIVRVAAAGNDGRILIANSAAPAGLAWQDPASTDSGIVCTVVRDVKPVGTNGGTFTAGAWQVRTLNEFTDTEGGTQPAPSSGGVFLNPANNTLVIPAGTYFALISAACYRVEQNRARLQSLGTAQASLVVALADTAGSLASLYFDYTTTAAAYRVWLNRDGAGVAPAAGGRVLFPVVYATNDTAATIAGKIGARMQPANMAAMAFANEANVYIRNTVQGAVAAATAGTSGFSVTVSVAGNATAVTLATSTSAYAKNSAQASAISAVIVANLVLATTQVVQLQHRCQVNGTSTGFGFPSSIDALPEVYTSVFIHRIKVATN